MTAPTTGRRSAGAATALITLERRGPVSLLGLGWRARSRRRRLGPLGRPGPAAAHDRARWNDPGRHAARQAGFTPLDIRAYDQQHDQVFEHTA